MLCRYLQGEAMQKGSGKRMRAVADAGLGWQGDSGLHGSLLSPASHNSPLQFACRRGGLACCELTSVDTTVARLDC